MCAHTFSRIYDVPRPGKHLDKQDRILSDFIAVNVINKSKETNLAL